MVEKQMVRNTPQGARHRTAEDGQHRALHLPGDAPRARAQSARADHLRGTAVL